MVVKVNGGIISDQTLTGGMRFFKIVGPFAWSVSNGSVNLPVSIAGGATTVTTYFVVGNNRAVPNSAAELALHEVSKQAGIVLIGLVPATYGDTTAIHIGVSSSSMGWGSDTPSYSTPPADTDEQQLPITPTAAALQMQAAIRALPTATVYVTAGEVNTPTSVPVTASASFASVTVTEVSFSLGTLTHYTLA
jgi:uncharacterized membrane protein